MKREKDMKNCFTKKEVDNFAINFVDWLTREDSDVVILYGEKDRFCSKERTCSTAQMLRRFMRLLKQEQ